MATDAETDTSRTTVKTYVPSYQREEWDAHADDLEMSRSEFVRSMVQAGRRGFGGPADGVEGPDSDVEAETPDDDPETAKADTTERPFEAKILEALSTSDYLGWDELVTAVTSDIEADLETTLQELQTENVVVYSGPNGGYTIDD
jgi:hypothetical protein